MVHSSSPAYSVKLNLKAKGLDLSRSRVQARFGNRSSWKSERQLERWGNSCLHDQPKVRLTCFQSVRLGFVTFPSCFVTVRIRGQYQSVWVLGVVSIVLIRQALGDQLDRCTGCSLSIVHAHYSFVGHLN